ncbi:hypothetical protein STCU_04091 [Strigomonas culicis]|uniref:PH domain-containing protein n=1 Tax=Strigomonas culicis TaxID=28005 RepID=S9UN75_9TRYP|nr:hypothetical protein STCU_04091 [Strigomonas culicis]|eukprot:EPY30388.1 hypothetical protein STCU_04091 [Strigomonas culicis]
MQAHIAVCTHHVQAGSQGSRAIRVSGHSVNYTVPQSLKDNGFPAADSTFAAESVIENAAVPAMQNMLMDACDNFRSKRENLVVFAYGVRSVPKRQLMYGSSGKEGYATKLMMDTVAAGGGLFFINAFVLGQTEHLVDLINLTNQSGVLVDSVKEGPQAHGITRAQVNTPSDVNTVMQRVTQSIETVFAPVLALKQPTPELEALPPYNGDTIVVQLLRYENEQDANDLKETNSMNFVSLGDSERPVLCGVNGTQQAAFERTHRILVSAASIISSIKCSRLRIPFGKSKMSQLLRRSYNAEKGYTRGSQNGNTNTFMFIHCFTDAQWAEETYHCLTMIRRMTNTLGSTGIGSMLRDLNVDKWRLDQDVTELREELAVAKVAYDYKPRIFDSNKNIANIKDEEAKYIGAIESKREEAREKQLTIIRQRAAEETARMIKEQEASSGTTLEELKQTLASKKHDNEALQSDRNARAREYEHTLEKLRTKKEGEEATAAKLKAEMAQLEEELSARQSTIQAKQKELEMAKLDKAKGREAILKEHVSVQAARKNVLEERRSQREQWIRQIKDVNEKVLEQIRSIAEERKQSGEPVSAKEEAAETAVTDDIKTIEEYLPKLISLEDSPVNPDETESIRRQFDDVFAQEKQTYLQKIDEEKVRKEKLEKGLDAYRNRVLEVAQARKKENLQDAVRKEQHLNALIDQVLSYLRHGVKMTKISSKGHLRRRFYFISEDGKRIHSCELDNQGAPINRKKPPVTIYTKDIRKVVLGCYSTSFRSFAEENQLAKTQIEAVTDQGTYRPELTQTVTPANLGLYNYRSFTLVLPGGKSLEAVCDSDTDYEAWMVGLKRILGIYSNVERIIEARGQEIQNTASDQQCTMKYGGPLDVRQMNGFVSISSEEGDLCSEAHVPPALLLRVKQDMIERSHTSPVTVYDVRVCSGLDLIRSGFIYDYLIDKKCIPLPL